MQMINITGGAGVAVPGREIKLDPDPASVRMARVSPWEDTPEWERQAVGAVYRQVADFVQISDDATAKLTRGQKGRFVALCWIAQIHKHIPDPKPSYVADWDDLPDWRRTLTFSRRSSGRRPQPARECVAGTRAGASRFK